MTNLNLISPTQKKELQLLQFYIAIKNLTIVLLLFTIIVAVILLFSKMIIQRSFEKTVADTTLTTKYGRIFNKEIEIFNRQLNEVINIQNEYITWTKFIKKLNALIPDGVSLNTLELSKETETIYISGFANTRDNFLILKENLENFDIIKKVEIPLESLFNKENIEFDIETELDIEKIKKL